MRFSRVLHAAVGAAAFSLAVFSAAIAQDLVCDGCVDPSDIAAGAVTTEKIANGAVSSEKIAVGAVTRDGIASSAVDFDKLDPAVVTAIQEGRDLAPVTVEVSCGTGETIQSAIDAARPGRVTTVVTSGNCVGDVLINKSDIVIAPSAIQGSVTVDGAQRVGLEGLRIDNRGAGIVAVNGASFWAKDVEISGTFPDGILVAEGSQAVIADSDIRRTGLAQFPSAGVRITDGATAKIRNSQIINNEADGIAVLFGGFARIESNTIENNGRSFELESFAGINVVGGVVKADGNTISNNAEAGVRVTDGGVYRSGQVISSEIRDNPFGEEKIYASGGRPAMVVAGNSTADLRQFNILGSVKVSDTSYLGLEVDSQRTSYVSGKVEALFLSVVRVGRTANLSGGCIEDLGGLCDRP